jgi:LemA protein
MNLIWIVILAAVFISIVLLIRRWITIYNKFIYWITKAERTFADIDVIMQQRIDMITALAQVVKKYDIHEYKTLKDVIEARSRWTKDTDLNSKVKVVQEIENNFIKLQAVFERYPQIKADELHRGLMGRGNISRIESRLRHARLNYNRAVQGYNERLRRFPRNIVAKVHGFKKLDYFNLKTEEEYKPKEIFED